jgi:epoxyqueuosine reductase
MVKIIAMKREKPHSHNKSTDAVLKESTAEAAAWTEDQLREIKSNILLWGSELGFQQLGVADIDLQEHEQHLLDWLEQGLHGQMSYMQRHGTRRSRPAELLPGTLRVISVRMDYLPEQAQAAEQLLQQPQQALISRYALGRDYHKLMRQRLQKLASRIEESIGSCAYRVFVDSAPVLEKALAAKAGLGWIGKHSNLLNKDAGSWFFLGEIYTNLPLPLDQPVKNHCGSCTRCLDICPTQAIISPYRVDARRCISYLTIELRESIPLELRPLMGNRIFGCDDCQFVCPWNRYAEFSQEDDFSPRPGLDAAQLLDLFSWSEEEFLRRTEGSAIRRIGHACWLRNIAVALGNAPTTPDIIAGLQARLHHPVEMVQEHVQWALQRHQSKA